MTLKELNALTIYNVDILIPSLGGGYTTAQIELKNVLYARDGIISEDEGEDKTPESQFEERRLAIVVT